MKKLVSTSIVFATLSTPAFAHPEHNIASGFYQGFIHPFMGVDHLLTMLAVGLWSGLAFTKRPWLGAATFVSTMALGAGAVFIQMALPAAEAMILLSLVVMGALLATARAVQPQWLTALSLTLIASFGIFHGYAHASEATGAAALFVAGFLASTTVLHMSGILIARSIANAKYAGVLQKLLGLAIAIAGVALAIG